MAVINSVSCMGPGTGKLGEPFYDFMFEVGVCLGNRGIRVATGGYGGVGMEAPSAGARSVGGRAAGYLLNWLPDGNKFLTDSFICRAPTREKSYTLRLARLLESDAFVIALASQPSDGTMTELFACLNCNTKGIWEGPEKRIAIVPESDAALDYAWPFIQGRKSVEIVREPLHAIDWILGRST